MQHVKPVTVTQAAARRILLRAQKLDTPAPFGNGPDATPAAIAHLGYVQIDTIHVIERCHHHILFTRIPGYRREHLHQAQSIDKSVFEYWTHALSYLPTQDLRFYLRMMRAYWRRRSSWFASVKENDVRKVMARIRRDGALTIRDIDDDVLVEKDHDWASRKPSRRAMQFAFFKGLLAVTQREGMLKTYDLIGRHFGWPRLPAAASERETCDYLLDRALRSQGLVSVDSVCYMDAPRKAAVSREIDRRVRRQQLLPVVIQGAEKVPHWASPQALERSDRQESDWVHILSPFDPLIIQRKRLQLLFDYEHRFEAYVPKEKRVFGYFACPVLLGDEIVAAIDLKADREQRRLLVRKWTWVGKGAARLHRKKIEAALDGFEKFQLS